MGATTVYPKLTSTAHLHRLSDLLVALGLPQGFVELTISASEGNTGAVAWGRSSMAAVTDGRTLDTKTFPALGGKGLHDTGDVYLYFETIGDKVDFDGTTR